MSPGKRSNMKKKREQDGPGEQGEKGMRRVKRKKIQERGELGNVKGRGASSEAMAGERSSKHHEARNRKKKSETP